MQPHIPSHDDPTAPFYPSNDRRAVGVTRSTPDAAETATMAPKSAIGKKKKSSYMNFATEKRAEWKKAGKVVPVPEQGKTL